MARTVDWLRGVFSLALIACEKDGLSGIDAPTRAARTVSSDRRGLTVDSPARRLTPICFVLSQIRERACRGPIVGKMRPGDPVDYLELRVDDATSGGVRVLGKRGTPCSSASNAEACLASLEAQRRPKSSDSHCFDAAVGYFVFTRGDAVGAVAGKEVPAFLAPIDDASEAAVAAIFDNGEAYPDTAPSCTASEWRRVPGGFRSDTFSVGSCDNWTSHWRISPGGAISVVESATDRHNPLCDRNPPGGRRSEAVRLPSAAAPETVADFFVQCAEMEAASVHAFRVLASELRQLSAPGALQQRALRSAKDEARHARTMRALAARYGGRHRPIPPPRPRPRSAREIALENAVAGCVEETWAALLATWQAEHANDPEVRTAMRLIARDETQHAALAWDIDRWFDGVLDEPGRQAVRAARDAAFARLRDSVAAPSPTELQRIAGLPTGDDALRLYETATALLNG